MEKSQIFKTIDYLCDDCNVYSYYDGLWVINPVTKEWVVHVASSRVNYLWFNYRIFHNIFNNYLSFNIIENSLYIKEWVVNRLKLDIGENCCPDMIPNDYNWSNDFKAEDVIDRGTIMSTMKYLICKSEK